LQLEELRAGKVELESRSLPLLQATELVLEPGRHHHVEIPLDWGDSWMLGQITNEKGEPVAGARVTVRWKRRFADVISQSYREATSDLEGFFAVSNLGARDYTLTVHAPGYSKKRLRHRIEQASPQLQALWPPPVAARLTESEG
jgi:hypothetical protein